MKSGVFYNKYKVNPCLLEGKPQNSLAAKGFRSVRPKFLTAGRKSPEQPSIHNGMADIRENSHNMRTSEIFSSVLPKHEASSLRTRSYIPCDTETEKLSSSHSANLSVPYAIKTENPDSSVSRTCQVPYNMQVDNYVYLADPGHLHNAETELQVTEITPSDSENDEDPVYKANLRTVCERMNIVISSSPNAQLTSERKRSSPLNAKKVSVEEGSKAWYKSMFKSDYNALKAEDYGMSSIVDARMKKWESDSKKQQPHSSSATDYKSRSQLIGPLPYSSTTKDNCTVKWPRLPGSFSSSDSEEHYSHPQPQYLHPNISDSKSDQSCSTPLSTNLCDTLGCKCQNDTAPPSGCQPTKPAEVPCNSLAAKDPHSHSSTKATVEENNWLSAHDTIDVWDHRVKPRGVFDFEPEKSSALEHDYPISIQSITSASVLRSKTRSLPTLAESTSQLTSNNTGQPNSLETNPSYPKFLKIQHYSSADQISINSKNELADVLKLPDVNQRFQSPKQNTPEETWDPRQPLKTELTVRVKYDFQGQTSKELPVRKGDIVFIHRQRDHNWYEGKCNGKSGLLPICYVEPVSEFETHKHEVLDEVAVARFRFTALTNIELPLEKNQTVVLLRRIDKNWYEGKYPGTNRKGIFPVTYVEVIGKPPDESAFHRDLPTSGSDLEIKMASQRPFQQFQQRSMNHANTQTGEEMYVALYSFPPNKDDELELRRGDLVNVIRKCGDGWYLGTSRRTKKFGTFPGNYVEKLCL
ncbi:uncharacterized protein LOC119965344 isoform X2 [Scyliorhinus canicula]|uniref:uncharacterized protein LOC119965344 isoform X2 n=1 Tax=Scyliorhinus canicula TaxID=7830 RepID=UPI0018F6ACF5|nr:uncharacterized protein LOC119965344 isoform X2 [Scyliorhinus canicula]